MFNFSDKYVKRWNNRFEKFCAKKKPIPTNIYIVRPKLPKFDPSGTITPFDCDNEEKIDT